MKVVIKNNWKGILTTDMGEFMVCDDESTPYGILVNNDTGEAYVISKIERDGNDNVLSITAE